MSSESAEVSRSRPFYARHAQAYDLLITEPVDPWVRAVRDRLVAAELAPADVLDAGCGTGRHAQALGELGHRVALLDASPGLLRQARRRCPSSVAYPADLCGFSTTERYDAVTCRGGLNDLLSDEDRRAAVAAMARALKPKGILFLDVRELVASRERADGGTRQHTVPLSAGEQLHLLTTVSWADGLLRVREEYRVQAGDAPVDTRCTTSPCARGAVRNCRTCWPASAFATSSARRALDVVPQTASS